MREQDGSVNPVFPWLTRLFPGKIKAGKTTIELALVFKRGVSTIIADTFDVIAENLNLTCGSFNNT